MQGKFLRQWQISFIILCMYNLPSKRENLFYVYKREKAPFIQKFYIHLTVWTLILSSQYSVVLFYVKNYPVTSK